MCKKIGVAALAIVAGLFIVKSTYLGAYARTAWGKMKHTAKAQVPIEFQIESLRNEVSQLVPDMRGHCHAIAQELVAVENLRNEVADIRTSLDKQKEVVREMNHDLKTGTATVVFNGHSVSASRLRDRLARELASCKRCAEGLKAKEQLLEAKERGLEAAREQLAGMKTQKEQLEVQIAQLEADVKTLRVAQTHSNFQLDDSRLATIKAQLADIRDQLRVEKIAGELNGAFSNELGETEAKTPTAAQISREADEFLGTDTKADGEVVGKK
jgi:peptidoglycan hydrolase CwlO-like protein